MFEIDTFSTQNNNKIFYSIMDRRFHCLPNIDPHSIFRSHFDIESIELKYNRSLPRKILSFPFTLDLYFPILEMKKKKKKVKGNGWNGFVSS